MFRPIKQVFIALFSFSGSLTIKFVSFNGPAFIDLSSIELSYYLFMIGPD